MDVEVSFPLDGEFLRRECPNCERQFKWHHGPTEERPEGFVDPDLYHCPYCDETADHESWFTREQLEYLTRVAGSTFSDEIGKELKDAVKPFERSGFIRMSVDYRLEPPPRPLKELDDMSIAESPCHPFEPVKVLDDWESAIHCLVCGEAFTV